MRELLSAFPGIVVMGFLIFRCSSSASIAFFPHRVRLFSSDADVMYVCGPANTVHIELKSRQGEPHTVLLTLLHPHAFWSQPSAPLGFWE